MMDYIKDPDTWLSLLAVVISMIALWQTHRQIKLSNKQQLWGGVDMATQNMWIMYFATTR